METSVPHPYPLGPTRGSPRLGLTLTSSSPCPLPKSILVPQACPWPTHVNALGEALRQCRRGGGWAPQLPCSWREGTSGYRAQLFGGSQGTVVTFTHRLPVLLVCLAGPLPGCAPWGRSQTKYLFPNPCLRLCFVDNPNQDVLIN